MILSYLNKLPERIDHFSGAFKLYDLDGDGTISKPEMLKIVKAISTMTGQSDDTFKPAERVEKIFATMDEVRP